MDPAEKRAAFEALKERNGNGRLVPEPRKSFTPKQRAAALAAYDGLCGACERVLTGRTFEVDHIIPRALNGPHVLANWMPLCKPCHADKTAIDRPRIDSAKRCEKRETEGPKPSRFPPGKPLKGGGFNNRLRRTMDGRVVVKTGAPDHG